MTSHARNAVCGMKELLLSPIVLLGVLMIAAPASAVEASFNCRKAASAIEKFICSHAMLRWQDLALSRSYRAAKNAAGSARDNLLVSQRGWMHERDRRCIADRTFEELSGPSTEIRNEAYNCLNSVYISRRRELQDFAAAPLSPRDIKELDLKSIAAVRPEIAEGDELRIAEIKASPDGSLLAILLPSLEIDLPDQIWLYRTTDRRLIAATPKPDRQHPHPDGSPAAIKSLAWQGDTLYARVAIWGKNGEGEENTTAVYAATMDVSRRLAEVPGDVYTLLDEARQPGTVKQDEVPESDWDILEAIQANRHFLAWTNDLGHGTIELRTRKRTSGTSIHLVAWGSWELWRFLFDTGRSQLVYAADMGITIFDLMTRGEQRIAGTSRGDRPYTISADRSLFVWSTRNQCGDEFLTEQDDSKPERFCLAHLPKPEAGR